MTPRQVKEFAEKKEADFAIGVPGVGRFRTNIYQQRGTLAFAFRAIPYEVKTIRELHLPEVLEEIALKPRGLVLVTGDHRLGQVHRARGDDQPRQPEPAGQRHHDRGPDRVPSPGRDVEHLAARGGQRHPVVRLGAAPRAAAGPRRDPDRRDPRHGDAGHGAQGGGYRPPGVLHAAHHRRHPDHQPGHLVLSAVPAPGDPDAALHRAPGGHLAAAGAARGRPGPGAGVPRC